VEHPRSDPKASARTLPSLRPDSSSELGAELPILAADLGQVHNPKPVEGYRMFIQMLLEKGVTPQEIEVMAKTNPAKLLDLE